MSLACDPLFPFDDAKLRAFPLHSKRNDIFYKKTPIFLIIINNCVRTHSKNPRFVCAHGIKTARIYAWIATLGFREEKSFLIIANFLLKSTVFIILLCKAVNRFKPFVAFFPCTCEDNTRKMLKPRVFLGTMPMFHLIGDVNNHSWQQLYRLFAPLLIPATA